MSAYAHTLPGESEERWEPLARHLQLVALGDESFPGAAGFAAAFGARDLARLAGLWHDIGKYAPQFQDYLRDSAAGQPVHRVDHSTAGALLASRRASTDAAGAIAFCVAGHHTGLPDLGTRDSADASCLLRRLKRQRKESMDALEAVPDALRSQAIPTLPSWLDRQAAARPLAISLFIRMVFSCLIDADRLATEAFCNPERAKLRFALPAQIAELRAALDKYIPTLAAKRATGPSPVDGVRAELLAACRAAAPSAPGLFSLTAPTGAGKTLSSMAFALGHAECHGLRRVIYVLPFTSVTEQNSNVFREAFRTLGVQSVLEHHSAYRPREEDESHPTEIWRRLCVENWDAPVVVTTNVQLFESLFASRPSDCRKLHRIAQSVVVLDEAQTLPVHLLRPTLAALHELVTAYGTSVVFCSATMPAISYRADFPIGLRDVREIVPSPDRMAHSMRRVRVSLVGNTDDEHLADRIAAERQVLAIVNTRKHAATIFGLTKARNSQIFHLSALMCPEHRSHRVQEIMDKVKSDLPCRVISTQVVEAGIDIDFPVVFRAFAGLDSIIQAAGRCNREGRRPEGRVDVFETDEPPPLGIRAAIDATRQVLEAGIDALALETIEKFFHLHYWQRSQEWDGGVGQDSRSVGLTDLLGAQYLAFRTAAGHYRLIDEWSQPIVVPYLDEGKALCHRLKEAHAPDRDLLRASQRFTVNVPPRVLTRLFETGAALDSPVGTAVLVLSSLYDDDLGLRPGINPDPADFIL